MREQLRHLPAPTIKQCTAIGAAICLANEQHGRSDADIDECDALCNKLAAILNERQSERQGRYKCVHDVTELPRRALQASSLCACTAPA